MGCIEDRRPGIRRALPLADGANCSRHGLKANDQFGDEEAKAAGIMLLPGGGFDVVPSDCLAVHVSRRLPDATRLLLSIGGITNMSRGTAKTAVLGITRATQARSGGRLVSIARAPTADVDFGASRRRTLG